MKLESLKESSGAANELVIGCCKCGKRRSWSKAVKEGWKADFEGRSFEAYYCGECSEAKEKVS